MVQIARPDSDISAGLWEPQGSSAESTLWESLDEVTPDDGVTYIEALNGENTTCEIGLSNLTDPVGNVGHIVRFKMQGTGSGQGERLNVALFDGATQIAILINQTSRAAWAEKTFTLTTTEADNITDYTDLRLKFITTNLGATEDMWCTWAEFEVPDVAGGTIVPLAAHHMKQMAGA